jgi:hypothetical protein
MVLVQNWKWKGANNNKRESLLDNIIERDEKKKRKCLSIDCNVEFISKNFGDRFCPECSRARKDIK